MACSPHLHNCSLVLGNELLLALPHSSALKRTEVEHLGDLCVPRIGAVEKAIAALPSHQALCDALLGGTAHQAAFVLLLFIILIHSRRELFGGGSGFLLWSAVFLIRLLRWRHLCLRVGLLTACCLSILVCILVCILYGRVLLRGF